MLQNKNIDIFELLANMQLTRDHALVAQQE